nr:immunoglobulin light chain junction region [Macaca mulatta]
DYYCQMSDSSAVLF